LKSDAKRDIGIIGSALLKALSAFRKTFGFPGFPFSLVPRKLETAQKRKVWAARVKPVFPIKWCSMRY